MEDGIKRIRRISCKEVSSRWGSVAMQNYRFLSMEQQTEFRYDFYRTLAFGLSKFAIKLTLRILMRTVNIVASNNNDWKLKTLLV